jgi:hypothetical protein
MCKRIVLVIAVAVILLVTGTKAQKISPQTPGFTKLATQATPVFTDATCPDGATCNYFITSTNGAGESNPSNTVSAAIPPTGVHTVTINGVVVPGATSYTLYQSILSLPPTITSVVVI